MEKTHAYVPILKAGFCISCVGFFFCLAMLTPHNTTVGMPKEELGCQSVRALPLIMGTGAGSLPFFPRHPPLLHTLFFPFAFFVPFSLSRVIFRVTYPQALAVSFGIMGFFSE